jgi:8-oxo-dGTP diphosphatase
MQESDYHRLVQTSTTVFLYKDDQYLLLKRNDNKRVDAGKLNGVGGRVDPGEDFLKCCIREVAEETGYIVTSDDIDFCGLVKLIGGYQEDWVICIYKVKVKSFEIPKGNKTDDGQLIWIDKDKVLASEYQLISDISYYFKDIVAGDKIFFMTAELDENEQVTNTSISYLQK